MKSPARRKQRGILGCVLLSLLTGCVLLILLGLLAIFLARRTQLPPPNLSVHIKLPLHGSRLAAGENQMVVLQTANFTDIGRYEVWANGALVARSAPENGESLKTTARLPWRPVQAGLYTLIGRAYDARGRGATSRTVVVEVIAPRPRCDDGLTLMKVEVQDGDTVESIAASTGATPECIRELNPGLEEPLVPGEKLDVPIPPEELPPDVPVMPPEEIEPGEDGSQVPAPAPPGQGEGPAQPGGKEGPFQLPEGLGPAGGAPPIAPGELTAEHSGECTVQLRWSDLSTDETGFRLYRMSASEAEFTLIDEIAANQELAFLVYQESVPTGGSYQYTVAAVNAGGEAPGPIAAVEVPREACGPIAPMVQERAPVRLEFAATSLYTRSQFDGALCYLSLARLEPHSRLPESDDLEFVPVDGGWNIAEHASGFRRFVFIHNPEAPVPVEIECWGRRGREHAPLGTWRAFHGPEEWDGRGLIGDTGEFRVTYHIQPYQNEPGFHAPGVDPTIPAPSNLALLRDLPVAQGMDACIRHLNYPGGRASPNEANLGLWACVEIWEQMLVWDWYPTNVVSRSTIDGFNIWIEDETPEHIPQGWLTGPVVLVGETGSVNQIYPVRFPSCGEKFTYRVQAFVSEEHGGRLGARTSRWSEPLILDGPACATTNVEFTFENLWVGETDDGVKIVCEYILGLPVVCWPETDTTLEGYGDGAWTLIGPDGDERDGPHVYFFSVRQQAGLIGGGYFGPAYRKIKPGRTYNLADEDMAICDPGPCALGPGSNSAVLSVQDGDIIDFWFWLQDEDPVIPDVWCGTEEDLGPGEPLVDHDRKPFQVGPYTVQEWSTIDQTIQFDNSGYALSDQDAECRLTVHVRGLGGTP